MSHPKHETIDPVEILSETEHGEHHLHVTPFWTMLWVFVALLLLTALTVWTSNMHGFQLGNTYIEFGGTLHIVVAMTIAVAKALLVAAFFMHLKYDTPMNIVVVSAVIFAVILFIGLTLSDSATRHIFAPTEDEVIIKGGSSQVVENAIKGAEQHATNPDGAHEGTAAPAPTAPAPAEPASNEPKPATEGAGGH